MVKEKVVQWVKGLPGWFQRVGFSFIGFHYLYITLVIIVGSVLIYPVRNIPYVDALFLASGAGTQAGLNVIDISELKLYQQLVLYLLPMVSTPIFIHSSVVFLRLYWYEKHFNGIKLSSKIQSRMRRTATMARANTKDYDIEMTGGGGGGGGPPAHTFNKATTRNNNENFNPEIAQSESTTQRPDEEDEQEPSGSRPPSRDIRFVDLPHPTRHNSVAPRDMYTSINMMQRNRSDSNDIGDDDGPALVIKGPREMDEEHERKEREGTSGVGFLAYASEDTLSSSKPESLDFSYDLKRSKSHNMDSSGTDLAQGFAFGKRAHTIEGDVATEATSSSWNPDLSNFKQRGRKRISRSKTFERVLSNARERLRGNGDETGDLQRAMSANYLSWEPTIGRNSRFHHLTPDQKEELGGVEYRALKLLAKILVCYYVGLHLMAAVLIVPWVNCQADYSAYIRSIGASPTWWGFFTTESGFNDVGFSITPDSMGSFNKSIYLQIVISFFMVVGNTGFPCLLRLIIWVMFKLSPEYGHSHESLAFLLDHPRRCFTLLFPSSATWWLVAVLAILNGVDLIFFIVLDLNNPDLNTLGIGYRIMNGLFQAFATRTTGFTVVDLADLHAGVQVGYTIMMYISVLPIAISIRRTNVYEEQSLGVYDGDSNDAEGGEDGPAPTYIANHLRRQLSFDLWYIGLGLFLLTITEGGRVDNDSQYRFDVFALLFELTSAYGTVGMSLGYPDTNTSFSAQFTTLGKLIVIAMEIRGRHRGLPYALDRAVMNPSKRPVGLDSPPSDKIEYSDNPDKFAGEDPDPDANAESITNGPLMERRPTFGRSNTIINKSSIGSGFNRLRRLSMSGLVPGPSSPPTRKVRRSVSRTSTNPGTPSMASPRNLTFSLNNRVESQAIDDQ